VPTYQYACTACDHQLEAVQSFADDSLTQCPVCDGRLRKLFGSVGIVFKGPGFYRTDSRNGANGNGSNGDGANSNGNGNGNGKKAADSTDSKPASTAKEKSGGKELAATSTSTT
jgi:putative FmdB family regulatory protein